MNQKLTYIGVDLYTNFYYYDSANGSYIKKPFLGLALSSKEWNQVEWDIDQMNNRIINPVFVAIFYMGIFFIIYSLIFRENKK